jgi:hypothetical protein
MRIVHLQLVLIGVWYSSLVDAQIIQVKLDLGQPKIRDERTVSFGGNTNLPPGTKLGVRTDLTGRPLKPIQGTRITPSQQVTVAADGSFKFTLKDQDGFKTGKYRIATQAWVYSYGLLGSSRPQSPGFYAVAGDAGENLRGAVVHRDISLLSGMVSVTAVKDVELSKASIDDVARKEKHLFKKYSKAIDEAYAIHVRIRGEGHYARWADKDNLRSNRIVVEYGLRLDKSHDFIRPLRTQEAFFQMTEAVDALGQVHYWSLPTKPQPAKYAQAVTDYETAKAKLDAFIASIQ